MNADVTLPIEGSARALPADASLALYRGAQEALTNVARYAPGARRASCCATSATATMPDHRGHGFPDSPCPRGLKASAAAMGWPGCASGSSGPAARCRQARPTTGWRVELEVPA